jgi:hypothetical protein
MHKNSDQKASSPNEADLRTSLGEVVRRVDLDRAAGTPGRFRHADPDVAGYEGVELARTALAGDQAALDEFHELAGLTLLGVTEYVEGDAVRIVMRKVDEKVADLEVQGTPVSQHGVARAVFQATNENRNNCTLIDASELVAWVFSPEGRSALACRGVVVPVVITGTSTPTQRTDPGELSALIEQLRHACSVALSDLLAFGMPSRASTGKLLQAGIVAAEEALAAPQGGAREEVQIESYCSACHRQVKSCDHTPEEREAWRHEAPFEPWQRQTAPGTHGLCPHCKIPTVALFGDRAGRCYACGETNEQLVARLKEQAEASRGIP